MVNTNIEVLGFFKAEYLFPLTIPTLFYALFYAFVENYLARVQKQFVNLSSYSFFSVLFPAFLRSSYIYCLHFFVTKARGSL